MCACTVEVLVQFCRGGRGFLNLEWVLTVRHPRRLVLAKLHHKRAMRTAWTNEKPRTLADRDETLLNLSCQTVSENMAQLDFEESTYNSEDSLIPTQWRAWSIPKKYYDPDLVADFISEGEVDDAFDDVYHTFDMEELKGRLGDSEEDEEELSDLDEDIIGSLEAGEGKYDEGQGDHEEDE